MGFEAWDGLKWSKEQGTKIFFYVICGCGEVDLGVLVLSHLLCEVCCVGEKDLQT